MVFAAGLGTRMAPLTKTRPKPLLKVGKRTLLDHALDQRKGLGVTKTVVNAHYKHDMISQHLADTDAAVSIEQPDLLDTGGGLKAAASLLGSTPCYTLNADVVWLGPNPLEVLKAHWKETDLSALLLLVPLSSTHNRFNGGDFSRHSDGTITRGGDYVYTGAQIIDVGLVSKAEDNIFSLNAIWNHLIETDGLRAVLYPGEWCDVGTPEGLQGAEKLWDAFQNG